MGTKFPPHIINHPESGQIRIGEEDDPATLRIAEVAVNSGSAASFRLFKDGGWEIQATDNKNGSNLIQRGAGPINISSEGDLNIDVDGTFSVKAKNIYMDALGGEDPKKPGGDIALTAMHNFKVEAKNNVNIIGKGNVTVQASDKLILHSFGWSILIGQVVRIHEPKSKLIPGSLKSYIDTLQLGEG